MNVWKDEIINTEKDFAERVNRDGIGRAFLFYADSDAVLMRGNRLIKGVKAISEYFDDPFFKKVVEMFWKPEFVDVSGLGDLGYTYGRYTLKYREDSGKMVEDTGAFHTVWKRQADGNWKFVWD